MADAVYEETPEQICVISDTTFASRSGKTIQIWSTDENSLLFTLEDSHKVTYICGAGENTLISSTQSELKIWDLTSKICSKSVDLTHPACFLGYSNGRIISVDDCTITVWDENEVGDASKAKAVDTGKVVTGFQVVDSDTLAVRHSDCVSLWSISRLSTFHKTDLKSTISSFCYV
jgi:hypothetical protein